MKTREELLELIKSNRINESKLIYLKSIGDHSVYESLLEYWKENKLI